MLYNLFLRGEFKGFSCIYVEQTFSVTLQCTSCRTKREREAVLSNESTRRIDNTGTFNLIVKCCGCDKQMKVNVVPPELKTLHCKERDLESEKELKVHPAVQMGADLLASSFRATGCSILSVSQPTINGVSKSGFLVNSIKIRENCWTTSFNDEFLSITDFNFELLQSK